MNLQKTTNITVIIGVTLMTISIIGFHFRIPKLLRNNVVTKIGKLNKDMDELSENQKQVEKDMQSLYRMMYALNYKKMDIILNEQ